MQLQNQRKFFFSKLAPFWHERPRTANKLNTSHTAYNLCAYCILYNLYCIVHIDYTDSQLYFDIILHYILYRMCVKINVLYVHCAMYSVHIAYNYICALRNKPCSCIYLEIVYLPSQDLSILRAIVK